MNLSCDLNEMVGIKETLYWYEIQIYIFTVWEGWVGLDSTFSYEWERIV